MRAEDEATRSRLAQDPTFWHGYHPQMRRVHRRNGDRLDAIFDDVGRWPGFALVGLEGSEAAWFIANHDIASPAIMHRSRELMATAVDEGEASATLLAYLTDRIASFERGHQLYGTQLGWDDAGNFTIWPPLTDPDRVDQRRQRVGLGILADPVSQPGTDAARPTRMSQEDLDALRRGELDFITSVGWRAS